MNSATGAIPTGFAQWLAQAGPRPDRPYWLARLAADGRHEPEPVGVAEPHVPDWQWAEALPAPRVRPLVAVAVGVTLLAGTWAKLPALLGVSGSAVEAFHLRYAPFYVLGPLMGFWAVRYRPGLPGAWAGIAAAGLLLVQSARPAGAASDAITADLFHLSALHAPALLLALGIVLALGRRWRSGPARLAALQLLGETAALAALFLLGGVLLVGLTMGLFHAAGVDIDRALFEWVVPYGALGVLPVGALFAGLRTGGRLAPLVARVFGPMVLVVLAVYFPVLVVQGGLRERDTLLLVNAALLAVLALVLLMEAERPPLQRHWTDLVALGLVLLALATDAGALASAAARLADGGLTPNRLAVLGMNVLLALHLGGVALPMARRALGRGGPGAGAWTARMLPVYTAWTAAVVLVFPFLF